MFRFGLLMLLAGLLLAAAPAQAKVVVMSCDAQWKGTDGGFTLDYESIKWRQHPRSCVHDSTGSNAGTIALASLEWTGWGKSRATAKGKHVANHLTDDGVLVRHDTVVQVRRPKTCGDASYYSEIRVKTTLPGEGRPKFSRWLPLFERRC